ncbi:MAG: hypothetical protein KGL39_01085 [Patescibacteria group bacterium]|nr:hypothetical protein [Patescibacteria group bacterium]
MTEQKDSAETKARTGDAAPADRMAAAVATAVQVVKAAGFLRDANETTLALYKDIFTMAISALGLDNLNKFPLNRDDFMAAIARTPWALRMEKGHAWMLHSIGSDQATGKMDLLRYLMTFAWLGTPEMKDSSMIAPVGKIITGLYLITQDTGDEDDPKNEIIKRKLFIGHCARGEAEKLVKAADRPIVYRLGETRIDVVGEARAEIARQAVLTIRDEENPNAPIDHLALIEYFRTDSKETVMIDL